MANNSVNNIKIEPVNVTWEIEQQDCITVIDEALSDYDGTFILLGNDKYIWFDLDASSVDPAPAGLTGIEVDVVSGDLAAAIATLIAAAVSGDSDYSATSSGADVTMTRADTSVQDAAQDGGVPPAGVIYLETQEGGSLDLGLLQGNVESTFEEQLLDITAHQSGTTIRAAVRQGVSAEISLTMQESDNAKYEEIFGVTGGGVISAGLFGWGTSRQGDNVVPQSRRLNLKPVNAVDNTGDLTFWKAYPLPETLTISGEEVKTLALGFRLFLDDSKDNRASFFVFGDFTQVPSA